MGEIVRVLEGPIAPMICATEGEMSQVCNFLDSCKTKVLWARVRDAVAQTLDAMTLAELMADTTEPDPTTRFIALSDIHVSPNTKGFYIAEEPEVRSAS